MIFHLRFEDDIVTGDTDVNVTLAYKGRDISCREEYSGRIGLSTDRAALLLLGTHRAIG